MFILSRDNCINEPSSSNAKPQVVGHLPERILNGLFMSDPSKENCQWHPPSAIVMKIWHFYIPQRASYPGGDFGSDLIVSS